MHELDGRWKNGPNFLRLPDRLWPITDNTKVLKDRKECHQMKKLCMSISQGHQEAIDYERFSSWKKLIRIMSWIKRLARYIKVKRHGGESQPGILTPEELQKAEISLIKDTQRTLLERMQRGEF